MRVFLFLWIGEEDGFGFCSLFLWVEFGLLGDISENGKVVCIGCSLEFDVGEVFWCGFWDGCEVIVFWKIYREKLDVVFILLFCFGFFNLVLMVKSYW